MIQMIKVIIQTHLPSFLETSFPALRSEVGVDYLNGGFDCSIYIMVTMITLTTKIAVITIICLANVKRR